MEKDCREFAKVYGDYYESRPDVCGGEIVFKGTRVTVNTVLASLSEGASLEQILEDFPTVPKEAVQKLYERHERSADLMERILYNRLKDCSFDLKFAAGHEMRELSKLSGAIYVSSDPQGKLKMTALPKREWYFEGIIHVFNHIIFIIDKQVAARWGILKK